MDDYEQEQEKILGVDDDLEDGDGGWVDTRLLPSRRHCAGRPAELGEPVHGAAGSAGVGAAAVPRRDG